ncbi:MAG: TIGR03936 family radical SAM-associated protein [Syntrophomonadales bacterium]|jgi:radical SAM-linked protein
MRWRVEYEKGPVIRYLSHLDMVRLWERLLRRSHLPIQLTKGFNPHLKISLGTVLPVGLWGKKEYLDMEMEEEFKLDELRSRLTQAAPPGIKVHRLGIIPPGSPSLMAAVNTSAYRILFPGKLEDRVKDSASKMKEASRIQVIRQKDQQEVDIRPGIVSLDCFPADNGFVLESLVITGSRDAVRFPELVLALADFGLPQESIIDSWREANYIRSDGILKDPLDS